MVMERFSEQHGKVANDLNINGPSSEKYGNEINDDYLNRKRCVWVNGPVIVGAGPSGLATAACLKEEGVPAIILEKADCIASLWQRRAYKRLKLHLPKQLCELPRMPFHDDFPTYLSKKQFIEYLESYAGRSNLSPRFNVCVQSAKYDETCGLWRVSTVNSTGYPKGLGVPEAEYICRWLIVATGENAVPVLPDITGRDKFNGETIHGCLYKNGSDYKGKNVLVVGCGNSGMEVSLDLANHEAKPSMVVRGDVHVLPREMLGKSTFGVAMALMKWFPLWLVDRFLLFIAWIMLGNTDQYGLRRPKMGPLEMNVQGKSSVLDVGALAKIRSGDIKVVPAVECLTSHGAKFVNGKEMEFDHVIFATGYKSNVPSWLEKCDFFSESGLPKQPFPQGWKGESGLYAVGFTRRGLLGSSVYARLIAQDIGNVWKAETKPTKLPTIA